MIGAMVSLADKPTLTGERVLLRPVDAADAPGLVEALADPETCRLTGTHPRDGGIETATRWYATRADHDDRLDLVIVERSTGEFAGEVVLNELDVPNRSCGFRISLNNPSLFGRGLGTEASRLVLAHAFETVGLHRVDLWVYAFNPRARHVYEKLGFVHEGTKREALYWDGTWVDAHIMALLAHEWSG